MSLSYELYLPTSFISSFSPLADTNRMRKIFSNFHLMSLTHQVHSPYSLISLEAKRWDSSPFSHIFRERTFSPSWWQKGYLFKKVTDVVWGHISHVLRYKNSWLELNVQTTSTILHILYFCGLFSQNLGGFRWGQESRGGDCQSHNSSALPL